ncbi:hypothetical protein [Catellatospora chokoriensis]|nr:hypothetical protein [Catellatospora chokoriensis]
MEIQVNGVAWQLLLSAAAAAVVMAAAGGWATCPRPARLVRRTD